MTTLDEREKRRLTDDLQGLYDATVEMYRYHDVGDHATVGDMLAFHLGAIRDLAGRLDIEIVEDEEEGEGGE